MDRISDWAEHVFSRARLGDQRLTARAVTMAGAVARHPGGTITGTMKTVADKEGAFRFVENRRVAPVALTDALGETAGLDCAEESVVFVVMDQTDLTFVDRKQIRGLGPDGSHSQSSLRSTQVMTSLALTRTGVPIGVLDQQFWLRCEEKVPDWKVDRRSSEERESWWWIEGTRAGLARLKTQAPDTSPWLIADRGADCHQFLREVIDSDLLVTMRASHNRVIDYEGRRQKLFSTLRRQPVIDTVALTIPRCHNRKQRRATCQIRTLPEFWIRLNRRDEWVRYGAVQIREVSPTPANEEPVCWVLLTTHPLRTADDAHQVIYSYTCRWRIEEFHKTWKSGACNVESSQLRSYDALKRWATILAAVAARVERLKRLSRETPDVDALTEFSQDEIDAAIYYMEVKNAKPGDPMTLQQAVRLIAMAGGYMGRNSDGPPGSITIRRGLERILPAAAVLKAQRRSG